MGSSPPGSSVRGIYQARVLEQVAISLSRRSPEMESASPVLAGRFFTTKPPEKLCVCYDEPVNIIL